jgi:hypothetical protein
MFLSGDKFESYFLSALMRKTVYSRIIGVALVLLVTAGCQNGVLISHPVPGHSAAKGLPPGQAKKIYGHQSARAFAPGQQKKSPAGVANQQKGNKHKKGKKKK